MSRKRRKGHRRKSPQGGWGMGSKEPIPKIILFIIGYNISELKLSETYWSLYILKPRSYNYTKKIKNFVTEGRPLGGFERSKSHFGKQLPFFSARPAKLQ